MTGSGFKTRTDKDIELATAGVAYLADIDNLLKLQNRQPVGIADITIQEGEFGKNDPPTDTTITTHALKKLAKDLNPETEKASEDGDKPAHATLELLKEQLATNITQCKLGAKTSTKENCEATEPHKTQRLRHPYNAFFRSDITFLTKSKRPILAGKRKQL
uniref:Variant surface glycoprotein n=1 Tax=Trypanosoma brucei TaxID=5691 RepID=A0A1V0FYN5_9TRYP|nr:variant surface glycoprotein [Trypanosoma brucei]